MYLLIYLLTIYMLTYSHFDLGLCPTRPTSISEHFLKSIGVNDYILKINHLLNYVSYMCLYHFVNYYKWGSICTSAEVI